MGSEMCIRDSIRSLNHHFHGFTDPKLAEAFHPKSFSGTTRGFSGWIEYGGAQTHEDAGLKTRHDQQLVFSNPDRHQTLKRSGAPQRRDHRPVPW